MMAKATQTIILIILLFACFWGYRMYRDGQSSAEHVLAYLKNGTSIAPTVCEIGGGDFDYNITGALYLSGTKMRADYLLADKGVVNRAHAVVEDGKTLFLWSDDDDRSFKMSRDQFFLIKYLEASKDKCAPWLLSDETLFNVPILVESSAR